MTAAAVMLWLTVTVTIPHPDLSAAEPSVREQIGAARAALENEAGGSPRKAELHGALGMIYHAYDLTAAAEACYRNAIAVAPEFRWHYYLGHVLAEQGDAEDAVAAFKAALRLDPGYLPANLRLARLQLQRQQLDEAERLYRRVLAVDADEAEALTGLGRVAFGRRDYTSALSHLQAALRRAPHATEIQHLIGLSYVRLKQRDRAREYLARGGDIQAIRVDPLLRRVQGLDRGGQEYQDRGATLLADGDVQGALNAFRRGVEARPSDPRALVNQGFARLRMGDIETAAADFQAALEIDPNYPRAHFNLGTILSAQGDDETAVAHYAAALRVDPGLVPARLNLANALRRVARHEESIEHYRRMIEAEPAHAGARLQEALALVRLGRHTQARDRLEEAHRLLPEDPWLRQSLVRVLAASPDPAARDGARAVELAEGLEIAAAPSEQLAARAMAHAEAGRFDAAIRDQQTALGLATDPALVERLRSNLERYRTGQPCRGAWRIDGPELSPRPRPRNR